MDSWKIVETERGYVIIPVDDRIRCPHHGELLLPHDFYPHEYRAGGKQFCHVDVHLKCPICGFWATYGVAVSKEDYEKLRSSPLKNQPFTDEVVELMMRMRDEGAELSEKDVELIKERLKLLGYW